MEHEKTGVLLVDYESDSEESESFEPIEITNGDFFGMNEEDVMVVSSLFDISDSPTHCASSRQTHVQAKPSETNCSTDPSVVAPIAASHSQAEHICLQKEVQMPVPNSNLHKTNNEQTRESHQTKHNLQVAMEAPEALEVDCPTDPSVKVPCHQSAKRTKYAVEEEEMSPTMLSLLKEVKAFFLRPTSLERISSPVAPVTILKALERIRCK